MHVFVVAHEGGEWSRGYTEGKSEEKTMVCGSAECGAEMCWVRAQAGGGNRRTKRNWAMEGRVAASRSASEQRVHSAPGGPQPMTSTLAPASAQATMRLGALQLAVRVEQRRLRPCCCASDDLLAEIPTPLGSRCRDGCRAGRSCFVVIAGHRLARHRHSRGVTRPAFR